MLKERKIILDYDICEECVQEVCMRITQWNIEDKYIPVEKRKKIYILLSSAGGEVSPGLGILDAIVSSETPVVVVAYAMAASMALYILAVGHERYCFVNTIALAHDGQTAVSSSSRKTKDMMAFYDRLDKILENYLVEHTKMDHEYLESMADRENYLIGTELKDMGIVDHVIGVDCKLSEVFD
jgi:ATP-dependent protease ClpP protease subunit